MADYNHFPYLFLYEQLKHRKLQTDEPENYFYLLKSLHSNMFVPASYLCA